MARRGNKSHRQNNTMKYQKLTIFDVLRAKIGTMIHGFLPVVVNPEIPGYKLIKDLTPSYTSTKNRIGIYENKEQKRVVVKRVISAIETLGSRYLKNEA